MPSLPPQLSAERARKAGRPPTGRTRTRQLHLLASDEDLAVFAVLEAELGLSRSDLIRRALHELAGHGPMLTPEEGATFRRLGTELHAIGVNLNQIARALNGGRAVGAREMRATVLDLAAHVSELQESLHHLAGRRRQQARAGVAQAREVDA